MKCRGASAVLLPLLLAPFALQGKDGVAGDPSEGGLITLHANDDLASSFDFRNGRVAGRIERGEIRFEDAQLAFDVFAPGAMSFGFVRDELADLIDLGSVFVRPQVLARDLAKKSAISIFHTLFFDGARFSYVGPGGDVHALGSAGRILGVLSSREMRHVQPQVGNVYVLRVRRRGKGNPDEFFKLQVVGLIPEHSLTLRWARVPT